MYIVYSIYFSKAKIDGLLNDLPYGERHSAWNTFKEANYQKAVLRENGYRLAEIEFDETVKTDNGHYYV